MIHSGKLCPTNSPFRFQTARAVRNRHCEEQSDEAIHAARKGRIDCFVALLLAMTLKDTASHSRGAISPELKAEHCPSDKRGRRESRVPNAPAASHVK